MSVLVVPKIHCDEINPLLHRIYLIKFICFLPRKGRTLSHRVKLKFVVFLCDIILLQDILLRLNLQIKDARGQCYDGAANMAGKTSGVAAQFKKVNPKMLFIHYHGHALKLAVKDACFKLAILKVTFEMTREICKLVKDSPQRNSRFEETRKTTKNKKKNVHTFCPIRWTVRGETFDY